jgi:hypothetical protein
MLTIHRCIYALVASCTLIACSGCSDRSQYIARAYLLPSDYVTSLRGYPTIEPPKGFTGTWIHWSYDGRVLAINQFRNGRQHGRQVYLDDEGEPYFISHIESGMFHHVEFKSPNQIRSVTLPPCYPRAWFDKLHLMGPPSIRID